MGEGMSGELGLAGYRFQYHVIVLTALEMWADSDDDQVESILVEGRPGAEKVDYELIGCDAQNDAIVQVKSRWGKKTWSAPEVFKLLMLLGREDQRSVRLELIANGVFSRPAQKLADILGRASKLDDETFRAALSELKVTDVLDASVIAAARRCVVTARSDGLPELREQVRARLRSLRGRSGHGIGDQAAELLRAYLLSLAMDKAGATDVEGRRLTREEFLAATSASRKTLEDALASRWGVPARLDHRDYAVRRDELLDAIGKHLKSEDGLHAIDGRVRTCVLIGPAGIGKTTLAQQYALENAAEFDWIYQLTAHSDDDDGISVEDVLSELEQFCEWLRNHSVEVKRARRRSLNDTIRSTAQALSRCTHSWLLIVDNAVTAEVVAKVIPPSGNGVVILTTRNSAWHGQQPIIRVGELGADQARSLVARRLGDIACADADIEDLCGRLDHMPLSLVTAASYLKSTREPIPDFLATLDNEVQRLNALSFPLLHIDDYARGAVAAVNVGLRSISARTDEPSRNALIVLRRASVVFSDRIPLRLLAEDREIFNRSFSVLSEFSLIDRWQDQKGRDWVRVHRLIQDVVRSEVEKSEGDLDDILKDVEIRVTDLAREYLRSWDLVSGGALRLHAITLAERLKQRDIRSWQTTTAMLSNAGTIARVQGDFAEAEKLFKEALSLIPPDDYEPEIAGRRGMTLQALASLQLEHNEIKAATETLRDAIRAHEIHRLIPAHNEAWIQCLAMQCRLESHTGDESTSRKQFEKLKSLPETTPEIALVRAANMVKIARDLNWRSESQSDFEECAERLLELAGEREHEEPLAAVMAHLYLAESHGCQGAREAAMTHYERAHYLISLIEDLDPTFAPDESLELVLGLLGLHIDKVTRLPYREIDELIFDLICDVEDQISKIDVTATQRTWVTIKLSSAKACYAANNGDSEEYRHHARHLKKTTNKVKPKLPANIVQFADYARNLDSLAEIQHARKRSLGATEKLSQSLAAPARPACSPSPCLHFASFQTTRERPRVDINAEASNGDASSTSIDRTQSIALHWSTLEQILKADHSSQDNLLGVVHRSMESGQHVLDHLMGGWRVLDTLSHQTVRITGHSIDEFRDRIERDLIRSQHDGGIDTVPTRGMLRCLNNDWIPELNDLLSQASLLTMVHVVSDIARFEFRLAEDLGRLSGVSVHEVLETAVKVARNFDSTTYFDGSRTYNPRTGQITLGQDMLGEPTTMRLHDPQRGSVEDILILGGMNPGKSSLLRLITLQIGISGVFVVCPADPRNEHNYHHLWASLVESPNWIATSPARTLENLDALARIIDARSSTDEFQKPTRERPGIFFALDDADDILALPRGQVLIEKIITRGPRVLVGLAIVIRDLNSLTLSSDLLRALANIENATAFGKDGFEALSSLRSAHGNQ
ncbi:hypothetical protein ILP97_17505 [Amycolatopsis sp. H6(2020)]|nr:hypothetical protein [Amycolatopsis sp. H6(2020)]